MADVAFHTCVQLLVDTIEPTNKTEGEMQATKGETQATEVGK